MSSSTFDEWVEYFALEPFGAGVENARHAVLAATVAQVAGAKVSPRDFLMGDVDEAPDDDEFGEDGAAALEAMLRGFGLTPDVARGAVSAPAGTRPP